MQNAFFEKINIDKAANRSGLELRPPRTARQVRDAYAVMARVQDGPFRGLPDQLVLWPVQVLSWEAQRGDSSR